MSLLGISDELIMQIVEAIQDLPTLLSVILTCRRLWIIAEPYNYSTLLFVDPTRVRLLEKALIAHPKRYNFIQELELRYSPGRFRYTTARTDVCSLSNLKLFVSESPYCKYHDLYAQATSWIEEMQSYLQCFEQASLLGPSIGIQRPLSRLKSMTLHWTGGYERYWEATASCPIFLLPELEILEISCVKIGQSSLAGGDVATSVKLHPYARQTNLKSLTITEGTISAVSLKLILSLPKALQILNYAETNYHPSDLSGAFATADMDTFNDALAQQSESLTNLYVLPAARREAQICSLKLSDFRALVSLRLACPPKQDFVPWTLSHPIPPALEVLQLVEASLLQPDELFSAVQIDSFLASSQNRGAPFTLDLVYFRMDKGGYSNFLRLFMKRLLSQCGLFDSDSLKLQFTRFYPTRTIPPYLYGERRPLERFYYCTYNDINP